MYRLTIYLIKEGVTSLEELIEERYKKDFIRNLNIAGVRESILILKDPEESSPDWYSYFAGKVEDGILKKSKTSPSALLLVRNQYRVYAIVFGYGRYLLNESYVVPDFGIKVCLNTLSSDKIKTVDTHTLEQMSLRTRKQAVIPIDFNAFSIEVERDLVKSVDGRLEEGVGKYLKGSTPLTIVTDKSLDRLSELCEELHTKYRSTNYKDEFGWIDNIKYINDLARISSLDSLLIRTMEESNFDRIFLGAPEITDDSGIKFYKISGLKLPDRYLLFPSIEQYISILENKIEKSLERGQEIGRMELSSAMLKRHKITAYNWDEESPGPVNSWSIYNCLHAEVQDAQGNYFKLLDGNWYEIDVNYLNSIDADVKKIPQCKKIVPHMNVGEKEVTYNLRLASHLNGACLDADFIKIQGRSKFEFCDVFTSGNEIIHVKKYLGASAISHLLYQAFVSGQLFSTDSRVRLDLSKKRKISLLNLQKNVNPLTFSTANYLVTLAIATRSIKPIEKMLSFFSKISLLHKYKTLGAMGYRVQYKIISIK